jgi:ATP-binding cassette subfamily B protein
VLVPYGVWLPAALFFGNIPSMVFVLQSSLRRREWIRQSTPLSRRTWYLEHLITSREVAAEIRIFNLGHRFIDVYQTLRHRLRREESALIRREAVGEMFAALLATIVGAGAGGWVIWQAIEGRMTAGALALFFAAFSQAHALARSLLHNAGQLYSNSLFLASLSQFLALETEAGPSSVGASPSAGERGSRTNRSGLALQHGIRFEGIDFSYPGSEVKALANFTLEVPAGKTVAIVGPNGAGKSTVIKLLCRFYEPHCGRICVDGVDIRDVPAAQVRRLVSVLFQEPVRYAASVAENVAPDSWPAISRQRIEAAIRAAGAESIVARLPHGSDTLLGKWFADGVELSGGEWQRLALARAFLRDSPLLLLDEPTSAMDSWAEGDWFDRLRQTAAGRTTIVITHRFTTAMQADIIHVMQDGRIIESGSHPQLLALGGRYADSWWRQTREQPTDCVA